MKALLEQFLTEECTPAVRTLLDEAMADPAVKHRHFELNRFEVTVDRNAEIVLIADVLDASDAAVERIPLAELAAALARSVER
jgi:hypothetical protein